MGMKIILMMMMRSNVVCYIRNHIRWNPGEAMLRLSQPLPSLLQFMTKTLQACMDQTKEDHRWRNIQCKPTWDRAVDRFLVLTCIDKIVVRRMTMKSWSQPCWSPCCCPWLCCRLCWCWRCLACWDSSAGASDGVNQTHHRIVSQRTDQTEVQQVVAEHAYPIAGQETIPQPGQCYAATDHHGIQYDSNGLLFLSLLCSWQLQDERSQGLLGLA